MSAKSSRRTAVAAAFVTLAVCAGSAAGAASRGDVALDVETGNPIHIARDKAERPVLLLANESDVPRRLHGRFVLADLAGHSLELPFDTEFAPGATNRFPLAWPLPGKGYWMAIAEVAGPDDFLARRRTTFAVLDRREVTPRLPAGKFRMGINYHYNRMPRPIKDATLDALVACGAKLVRCDFAAWDFVQPKEDVPPKWDAVDRGVADFESHGIDLDAICWGNPRWAATPERRASGNWYHWYFTLPERQDLLHDFMRDLAARYATRIAWYEIGNEWELGFHGDADEAIAALKLCYTALKEGNPAVKVISNGWASWDSENAQVSEKKKGFPEKVMKEAHGFYDAHPVHNHGMFSNYRRAILTRFLPRRREMGIDDVPWYSNETALSGVQGNEVNVAEHVWKKILFAWAYGSCDYIWYNLRATGDDENDPEAGYGMMTRDLHPRPSYCSFAALTELLSGFDFDRIVASDGKRELYIFAGERGGMPQRVLAGWDEKAEPPAVSVGTDAVRAWTVDFMGNRAPASIANGICEWTPLRRPSALLLEGATFADCRSADSPSAEDPPILVATGPFDNRHSDLEVRAAADVHGLYDANPLTVHRTWKGPEDVSFRAWFGLKDGDFQIRVRVEDDVHRQNAPSARLMSEGDCLRATLAVAGRLPWWELGFRRTDTGLDESVVWSRANREMPGMIFHSRREEHAIIYDVSIPLSSLGLSPEDAVGGSLAIALKVDDDDGEGRDLWIGTEDPAPLMFGNKRPNASVSSSSPSASSDSL